MGAKKKVNFMKFLNTSEVISQKLREEIVAFEIFIDGECTDSL